MSKDIVGKNSVTLEFDDKLSVQEFRRQLTNVFPGLKEMETYTIAVNEEYAEEERLLSDKDTIAIIPPVCGG